MDTISSLLCRVGSGVFAFFWAFDTPATNRLSGNFKSIRRNYYDHVYASLVTGYSHCHRLIYIKAPFEVKL